MKRERERTEGNVYLKALSRYWRKSSWFTYFSFHPEERLEDMCVAEKRETGTIRAFINSIKESNYRWCKMDGYFRPLCSKNAGKMDKVRDSNSHRVRIFDNGS